MLILPEFSIAGVERIWLKTGGYGWGLPVSVPHPHTHA